MVTEPTKPFPPGGETQDEEKKDQPTAPGEVPGYTILGTLGRGGMGVVYKARQLSLNRVVALKMILAGAHAGAVPLARFQREAEAVARLQHPGIVQIHEVGEHDGLPWIALEFIAGGTLARKLAGTPQSPQEAARLVEALARAIHHAHEQGIVHRDLKPSNVLLSADGVPKISDFGLAKQLDEDTGWSQTGDVLGTPSYMAPEQASGRVHAIGPTTDVYALGAILYQCLTGGPPFRAPSSADTLQQVLSVEPVAPSRLQPKLPRDLETICLKCLQKDPARRYTSAIELAEDLERFRELKPIRARPVGRAERLWRWCKRNPALASASGLATFALLATLVALAVIVVLVLESRDSAQRSLNAAIDREEEEKRLKEAALAAQEQAQRESARRGYEQARLRCVQENGGAGLLALAASLEETIRIQAPDLEDTVRQELAHWGRFQHRLTAVLAHKELVGTTAFCPDGKLVLTTSHDHTSQVWDVSTGRPVGPPLSHKYYATAGAFSPDGKVVVTGGWTGDNTARLWRVGTGEAIGLPMQHEAGVGTVAFSPDGKTIVTGSGEKVRFWDAETGRPSGQTLTHPGALYGMVLSLDGEMILTWGAGVVQTWQVQGGKPLGAPLRPPDGARIAALSPDGKTILTAGGDWTARRGEARLWEVGTGKALGQPMLHHAPVLAAALSPDGKTILTGAGDGLARLWEAATGKPLGRALVHDLQLAALAFSPDGEIVATASGRTVRLWDAVTGQPLGPALPHLGDVGYVIFSPDGKTLATSGKNETRLWEVRKGMLPGPAMVHRDAIHAAALSSDGRMLLTGSGIQSPRSQGEVRLWDLATGKPLGKPLPQEGSVSSVAISPDGKTFATVDRPSLEWVGRAWLWDAGPDGDLSRATRRQRPLVPPNPNRIARIPIWVTAFSPDGRTLLTGGQGVELWDVETGKSLGPRLPHLPEARWAIFSPDGRSVLAAGWGPALLWDVETRKQIGRPLEHENRVFGLAFSPDGKALATGSLDGTARVWDARTCKPLTAPLAHQAKVRAVAFSPDGKLLATGSDDSRAQLWDVATGKPLGPPLPHQDWVSAVLFSRDGRMLVTAGIDGKVRRWPLPGPLSGELQRLTIWVQVTTGMELVDGAVKFLDHDAWQERVRLLGELGGPPGP
jgi:WD40 repeat protein